MEHDSTQVPAGGQAPPADPSFQPAPAAPAEAPAIAGQAAGAPDTAYSGGAGGAIVTHPASSEEHAEETTPEAEAAERAAEAQAEAAHAAAAAHVATAGPIVWGDRGELVQIAAKLLARATGQENPVSAGTGEAMWSSTLADLTARFQDQEIGRAHV